jgi:hypothetical protein
MSPTTEGRGRVAWLTIHDRRTSRRTDRGGSHFSLNQLTFEQLFETGLGSNGSSNAARRPQTDGDISASTSRASRKIQTDWDRLTKGRARLLICGSTATGSTILQASGQFSDRRYRGRWVGRIGRHQLSCCIQTVRGTVPKSAGAYYWEHAERSPGAGGCDEAAAASAEPDGVEPVRRPGRPVWCPGVHAGPTHQAGPPGIRTGALLMVIGLIRLARAVRTYWRPLLVGGVLTAGGFTQHRTAGNVVFLPGVLLFLLLVLLASPSSEAVSWRRSEPERELAGYSTQPSGAIFDWIAHARWPAWPRNAPEMPPEPPSTAR